MPEDKNYGWSDALGQNISELARIIFTCILCIHFPKEAVKNKIYSWIYQIFIEHLLCQDFPNVVCSQDAFGW